MNSLGLTDEQLQAKLKWWEKTVEYFFIQKYVSESIIAPLDGNEELAGDALVSSNQKWVIIEFKDRESSLNSEMRKFKSYERAKQELKDHDHHHCLIYGKIKNGKFDLGAQTYFSRKGIGTLENFLKSGLHKDAFIQYLQKLISYKAKVGSTGSVGSYSFVAGISKNNKITSCMSLYEFDLENDLKLEAAPKQEKESEHEISRGFDMEM
ncbi:hypothetical protein KWE35_04795 [Acinetobacter baumannii]|uniref:hypothetical protein n=3 Tax=Acinetobacter nosocomialis TaxID=106654 RepID=UPI00124E53A8|nr:hypothetical protein [Acinetobacter nosocomialis]MCU4551579.1 hypothetical protein [Acinetobacter nosocomialis]